LYSPDVFLQSYYYENVMKIDRIEFHPVAETEKPYFSILIPSWNNLPHLKLCIDSIRKNSFYHHQIVVHANEANDGTLEWLQQNGISHTYSKHNVGVCYGFNAPYSLAKSDYICLIDDDVYVCPNWDKPLWEEIEKQKDEYFCISGTLIEHTASGNNCVLSPFDFGKSTDEFNEQALLAQYNTIPFSDWNGCNWYPLVIHRHIWNLMGGLSVEFSPGMYSDPDFMMKLWHLGVRYFKGVSASRTYHFISRTTSRVKKNNGNKQFLLKWGISSSTFFKFYLKLATPFNGSLQEPVKTGKLKSKLLKDKIKHVSSLLSK